MSGPTLTATVLPTVQTSQPLRSSTRSPSHSRSTPDLLSSPEHAQTQTTRLDLDLDLARNRSLSTKSLPTLPAFDLPSFDFGTELDTTLSFSSEYTKDSPNEKPTIVRAENNMAGPESRISKAVKRRNTITRPQSWMPSSKGPLHITENACEGTEREPSQNVENGGSKFLSPNSQDTYRAVSDSFSFLTKRSWMPGSRSPSPGGKNDESEAASPSPDVRPSRERSASNSSIMKLKKSSRKRPVSPAGSSDSKSGDSRSKFGTYLDRIKQRQPAMLMKGKLQNDHDSPGSSTASLAPPSTETRQSHASETSNSTFPEENAPTKSPQSRDGLWLAFKTLDTDYHTFQVKSTSSRMNLVRTTLVPFLRNHANHPSNRMLHYEDLERRALILNKWWTGLLELYEGKNQQPVPGVDRPVLLETLACLMTRPEWRQCAADFSSLADRNTPERLQEHMGGDVKPSSASVDSTDSTYLAESARHNVKMMFIANLVSQMGIVVEKLSLRHAPLSLVNFAGKACAYAFFFAPGIADILVRLWSLSPDLIRRVADEFGLPRRSRDESDDISSLFPHCIERLGWTSVRTLSHSLKQAPTLPVTSAKIPWRGSWTSRWTGRDTDLFFIFCKYYYILADDFTPAGLPLVEKARAPGFVLVNAQVLSILDSTIHRQAAAEAMLGPPLADAMRGADASAMALPTAPNNNIMKGMNENRLVVLLKDFLFTTSLVFVGARHTFGEAFMAVMKASAKRTSQYNHNACFTICDFLEESLPACENFNNSQNHSNTYVDWPFWLEVCKKILSSNNTMSEIRVLSLIFSIWEAIAKNQARKERFCMGWLLTEEIFNKMFNNWCPMVRAYYMRLLCWRICRDAGSANESDAKIFLVVYARLKTVWSHYLWLKQTSEQQGKFPPSTAPSYPTPGKRFMIIRTEFPVAQPGLLIGFDSSASLQQSSPSNPATDFESMESMDSVDDDELVPRGKKGGILGRIFSFSGSSAVSNDLEAVRRETAALRTRPALPSKGPASPPVSDTDSIGSSPTYEDMQYVFKFTLSWNPAGTHSPPNRILTRPRLPAPAHSWVTAKGRTGSPPPPPPGRPAPTRAVSGSPNPGLVDSARNANPPEVPITPHRISMTFDRRQSFSQMSPVERTSDDVSLRTPVTPTSRGRDESMFQSPISPTQESIIMPVEPKGGFATGVKYTGRALAEWSLVIAECNSFVDRRREEGVFGLSEVEVPTLGVEGFRKPA
ncbi:DUF1765-domain-containing protein [Hypoxylon sp. FL1150]|nr:DUF1765-domain-containing protein [Hypoxylon sp. FL1150]